MSLRRLALTVLAVHGLFASPVLAAGASGIDAPPSVSDTPGTTTSSSDPEVAALDPLPEVPPAPALNGPTLAAMQLALPIFGAWILSRGWPDDLNPRDQTYTLLDGSTRSDTTKDYRPEAALAAAGTSLLLLPGYASIGQLSAGTDALLTTCLMAGFGALVGYQAGGQPPFSGNLTGQALDDKRIGTALIGTGLGFLTGQIRSALDVWARADAMQAEHDRVKALRDEMEARRAADDPTDKPVVVDPHKPLGDLSLVPPSAADVTVWSLINVAGHVVLPTVGFTVSALTTPVLGPLSAPLWMASIGSFPAASGLAHFTRGDWSAGVNRGLASFPVTALGAGGGAAVGALLGAVYGGGANTSVVYGAAVGMLMGSLISLVWWDVESARDALIREQARKREASEHPAEAHVPSADASP